MRAFHCPLRGTPVSRVAIAEAMNTVEYVPLTMPTSIVNAKPRRASPPNRYSASRQQRHAGGDTVRDSVWLTLS